MLGLLHLWNARLHYLVWIEFVDGMCRSNSDFEVQSAGYNPAQSPTNWQSIHGKDPSILCRQGPPRLSIGLDDKNPKCGIQDCGLRLETCTNLVDTIFSRICYQHNYSVFGTKTYAKLPEIWDVPDWFRCMCEFQVRQVMSPQNSLSKTYIL